MRTASFTLYLKFILGHPVVTLGLVLLCTIFFGYFASHFELEVSADALVLENDKDLRYYRSIRARYGSDEFLVVSYTPQGDLFSKANLDTIRDLRDRLTALERVESVVSILDVPLIQSPPLALADLAKGIPTLSDARTNLALARIELTESPLYKNRLVGEGGDVTALQINFYRDPIEQRLLKQRDALWEKRLGAPLTSAEKAALLRLSQALKRLRGRLIALQEEDIASIRIILDEFRESPSHPEIFLGGVPMIVTDMMHFVRHDLRVFGVGVLVILALLLFLFFRQPRWVILPLLTALAASIVSVGFLGLAEWRVTVVSSNFLSLLMIFSLSLSIHLIVRYRELQAENPNAAQRDLVRKTIESKLVPCFYTVVTTMAAFGSLVVSGIRPVIDFGWIMVISLGFSLLLAFTLFPAAMMLLPSRQVAQQRDFTAGVTAFLARCTELHAKPILLLSVLALLLSAVGISSLTVENRFIDYFKASTEIYKGMYLIDRKLGGTTPLEVIIDAPPTLQEQVVFDEDDFDSDFEPDPEFDSEAGITGTSYWFNSFKINKISSIHHYLESLPETGKVISLATTLQVLEQLNESQALDNLFLAVLYKHLPDEVKQRLITPYLSEDGNQLRFSVRIYESDRSLKRQALLQEIRRHLTEELGLADEQVHLSGMLVIYDNMLQSLFRSQILTLGAVIIVIMLVFWVLFRSLRLALVAIIPNLMAAFLVLGLIGGLGIPLDIMTITIAAISVGIGVDNTIHYVHRFGEELAQYQDYWIAVRHSHASIGRAMYYTTLSISLGFSILCLSDFMPTIYFGLLASLAMLTALAINLTVLPLLLATLKPYRLRK